MIYLVTGGQRSGKDSRYVEKFFNLTRLPVELENGCYIP